MFLLSKIVIHIFFTVIILSNAEAALPKGFVSISDLIPEIKLDIRYYTSYNFVGERIRGYDEPVAIATINTVEALREVVKELEQYNLTLIIYDAYRPQKAVDHFVEWGKDFDDIKMKSYFYPNVSKCDLFDEGYIAYRSNHSKGSTVDVSLYDLKNNCDVDMGGMFDYFGELSHSDYLFITEKQRYNRILLRKLMLKHGFVGIDTEWWHYTLKDEPFPNDYFNFPNSIK